MTRPATCHPDKARKLADGTCDSCYARERYRNDPVVRERVKTASRIAWHKEKRALTDEQKRAKLVRRNERYASEPEMRKKVRAYQLRRDFGISTEEYAAQLSRQGEACAICGVRQEKEQRQMAVDHCHKTGEIRGILCHSCNRGIGSLGDEPGRVEAAAKYLREFHWGAQGG